jgi:hypothetical protein
MPEAAVVRCGQHHDRWSDGRHAAPRRHHPPTIFTLAAQKLWSHVFFFGENCYIRFLLFGDRNGQNKSQFNVSRGTFKASR